MLNQIESYYLIDSLSEKFQSTHFNLKNFTIVNNNLGMHSPIDIFIKNKPQSYNFYHIYSKNIPFSSKNKMYANKGINDFDYSSFSEKLSFLRNTNIAEAALFEQDLNLFMLSYKEAIIERNAIYKKEIEEQELFIKSEKNSIDNIKQKINSFSLVKKIIFSTFKSEYKKDIKYITEAPLELQKQISETSVLKEKINSSNILINQPSYSLFLSDDKYKNYLDEVLPKTIDNITTLYNIIKSYLPKPDKYSFFNQQKQHIFAEKISSMFDTLIASDYKKTLHLFYLNKFSYDYSHGNFNLFLDNNPKYSELYLKEYSTFQESPFSITSFENELYISHNVYFPLKKYNEKISVSFLLQHAKYITSEFSVTENPPFEIQVCDNFDNSSERDIKIVVHDEQTTKLFFNSLDLYFKQNYHVLISLEQPHDNLTKAIDFISKDIRKQYLTLLIDNNLNNHISVRKKI